MKIKTLLLLSALVTGNAFGQEIDTLRFYSKAFEETRTVTIYKPEFYQYKSDLTKLPVIYILDGQHEWFVDPLLSDINYLQYTHEIPEALVVVIPLNNRNKECGIIDLETELPLDKFITEELNEQLKKYQPNDFKVIIGHSFSASFALYSFYNHPDEYAAVIANSPYDEMDMLVNGFEENSAIDKSKISIAIGGRAGNKDFNHRKKYDELRESFPTFFASINTFEANYSAHNAVPIVATPSLLTKLFNDFSSRYYDIAKVDKEYKLITIPETTDKEMSKIREASTLGNDFYPPEIPDINGIASRYSYSGYYDDAVAVYEMGLVYYPNFYDFYLSLYDLQENKGSKKAQEYLNKALKLLKTFEKEWEGKGELIEELEAEMTVSGE